MDIRESVANACRMLTSAGLLDYSGHISVRDPIEGYWIHTVGKPRYAVTPSDVVRVSIEDGSVLEGSGKPPRESAIHSEIYRARLDVGSVAHLHPPITTAIGLTDKKFVPVILHGAIFGRYMPIFDDCRHIDTKELGEALARTVGSNRGAIMRGHGAVVVGPDLMECFMASIFLEDNARHLWRALAVGEPHPLSEAEIEYGINLFKTKTVIRDKVWAYYREGLELSTGVQKLS